MNSAISGGYDKRELYYKISNIVQLLIEYAMKSKLLRVHRNNKYDKGKRQGKGELEEAKRREKETNILERKQKEQGISKNKN